MGDSFSDYPKSEYANEDEAGRRVVNLGGELGDRSATRTGFLEEARDA